MEPIDKLFGKARVVVVAVTSAILLVVILQNLEAVETRFLFMSFTMPRAFLLAVTALAGFVIGVMVTLRYR